jgi:hypothetical protein
MMDTRFHRLHHHPKKNQKNLIFRNTNKTYHYPLPIPSKNTSLIMKRLSTFSFASLTCRKHECYHELYLCTIPVHKHGSSQLFLGPYQRKAKKVIVITCTITKVYFTSKTMRPALTELMVISKYTLGFAMICQLKSTAHRQANLEDNLQPLLFIYRFGVRALNEVRTLTIVLGFSCTYFVRASCDMWLIGSRKKSHFIKKIIGNYT